MLVKCI